MASEDDGKTEDPTAKRQSDAKKDGKMPRLQDLTQAVSLFVAAIALWYAGGSIIQNLSLLMTECFRAIATWRGIDETIAAWGMPAILFVAKLLLPVALPVVVSVVAITIFANGFNLNFEVIGFDLSKAFHFSMARMFGSKMLVELAKGAVRMAVVAYIGFRVVWGERGAFLEMAAWPIQAQSAFAAGLALEAVLKMALALIVLGIADWTYQKRTWFNDLKMTKHEIKDEAKQGEGDPLIKNKIRQMRLQMHRRFMMREVPKATVVVTNPTHYAVAIRYTQGVDRAPIVVAKGADLIAKRIRELAAENGVPLIENPPLARALHAQVEPGDEIPADLYAAVAELLAFVFRTGKSQFRPVAAWGLLLLAAAGMFQQACSMPFGETDDSSSVALSVPDSKGEYRGGEVVVKADLRRVGQDSAILSWGLGRATLVSRGFRRDGDGNVVLDSLVVRWDTLPGKADTAGKLLPQDTLRYYIDHQERSQLTISVKNVLPRLDSVLTGSSLDSTSQRTVLARQDTFVLAVHPGENALIRFRMTDPDKNWPSRWDVQLPLDLGPAGTLAWRTGNAGDSIMLWKAPTDSLVDTTVTLQLADGLGGGRQPWRIRLCTYREQGSIWAGTRSELVKIALTRGSRPVVAQRLRGFGEIVAMDIDPVREGGTLLAIDRGKGTVRKFTSTGIARTLTETVKLARSVACDVDAAFCWVGGGDSTGAAGLLSRIDGSKLSFGSLPGSIQSVAVDQGSWGRAWFTSADSGFLGRTSGGKLDTLIRGRLRRPVSLAWDESQSILWVADLAAPAVVGFDSSGSVVRRITSVHRPVGLSAAGGRLWVADLGDPSGAGTGEVLRFGSDGTLQTRCTSVNAPRSVAIDPSNPDKAWIADTENGRMVLLNGATEVVSTAGLGLDRPDLVAIHRGAP
jgi:flagellar biosynthesis protein FlhB